MSDRCRNIIHNLRGNAINPYVKNTCDLSLKLCILGGKTFLQNKLFANSMVNTGFLESFLMGERMFLRSTWISDEANK